MNLTFEYSLDLFCWKFFFELVKKERKKAKIPIMDS